MSWSRQQDNPVALVPTSYRLLKASTREGGNTMKICPQCNTPNRDTARFCSNCRENLSLPSGTLLERGRFEIARELGRGGFGAVYLAQDVRLKRDCVVKHLLIPAGASEQEIDDLRRTFEREADALVGLNQPGHPNIPEIYDFFSDAAGNYLVMKYIGGETLEQRLAHQGGRLPWKEAVEFAVHVADALAYMHGRTPPVLHRDIKPANVLLDTTGRVWLVDFGLSKAQSVAGGGAGLSQPMGTPGYAPPEQHKQGGAVPRSDVYALAATLYHLVTGDDPASHPFQFPQLGTLPPGLQAAVANALETDPARRPASAPWKAQLESIVRPAASVQPLKFPQNEAATNLPTLTNNCARHWDYARRILYDGTVEHWLRTALHDPVTADRVQAIVTSQKDQDVGLDQFIREFNPVFPPSRLRVNAAQLDAGSLPWQQTCQLALEVTNAGHGALQTQVKTTAPWLTVTPAAFSCVAGHTVPLVVKVDAAKLDPGQSYQAQVTLDAGSGRGEQVTVTVAVPAPQLVVDPPSLNLGSAYQGETLSKTFVVRNTGGSAFEGRLSCDQAWASVKPGTARVEPGRSVMVTVKAETGSLSPGEHTASVRVGAQAGRWSQAANVPARARLPLVKTLWHRWAATLDWAAVSTVLGLVAFLLSRQFVSMFLGTDAPLIDVPLIVGTVFSLLGGVVGWRTGKGARGLAAGIPALAGAGLAATGDVWLGLAPAVALMVLTAALLGGAWGLGARSKRRQGSGVLAIAVFALALVGIGYLTLQPRYWWHQVRILEGHTSWVSSVAFSPDGATLASGSADRTVRLWRVADGSLVRTLEGHSDDVTSVAFSPDGATLASGSADRTVRLWQVGNETGWKALKH
jgi:serine/threonine protein kinase